MYIYTKIYVTDIIQCLMFLHNEDMYFVHKIYIHCTVKSATLLESVFKYMPIIEKVKAKFFF